MQRLEFLMTSVLFLLMGKYFFGNGAKRHAENGFLLAKWSVGKMFHEKDLFLTMIVLTKTLSNTKLCSF